MIFCDDCGSVMLPSESGKKFVCTKCGKYKLAANQAGADTKVKEEVNHSPDDDVYVDTSKEEDLLPTTTEECEKCHNRKAVYWFEQTRSLDEPTTRFFRCTKCKHTWREYS